MAVSQQQKVRIVQLIVSFVCTFAIGFLAAHVYATLFPQESQVIQKSVDGLFKPSIVTPPVLK